MNGLSDLLKQLIASLIGSSTILRTLLTGLADSFMESAKATEGKVDDLLAMVLKAVVTSDDLWEQAQSLLLLLFGITKAATPIEENAEVGAFAERVADTLGQPVSAVHAALCSLSK
jgi:predicted trehalose synthase